MKPFTVSVSVDKPREEVHAFLADLANHQAFTDHFLVDWTVHDPRSARFRSSLPGPDDWMDATIVAADPPERIVEETVGARGQRRTRGTYVLHPLGEARTRVQFTLRTEHAPLRERLLGFAVQPWLRGRNQVAMNRLGEVLDDG